MSAEEELTIWTEGIIETLKTALNQKADSQDKAGIDEL